MKLFGLSQSKFTSYLIIMRVDHWLKNFLIFPGVVLAMNDSQFKISKIFTVLISFFGVSLAASANYTINEYLDRSYDSHHPRKRYRLSVLGRVTFKGVLLLYIFLYFAAFSIFAFINAPSLVICFIFFLNGLCYNLPKIRLKEKKYLDILSESLNSPLRVAWGWYSLSPISTISSSILIAFWMTGIFLMSLKRFVEVAEFETLAEAKAYRVSLAKYSKDQLLRLAMIGSFSAAIMLGIFIMRNHLQFIILIPFIIWLFTEFIVDATNGAKIIYSPETTLRSTKILIILGLAVATASTLYILNIDLIELTLKI